MRQLHRPYVPQLALPDSYFFYVLYIHTRLMAKPKGRDKALHLSALSWGKDGHGQKKPGFSCKSSDLFLRAWQYTEKEGGAIKQEIADVSN